MTREEAIKWLEETIQDTDTYWESCSEALQKELDEQKEVFLLALSALRPVSREQVEDELGLWVYCNDCCALGPTKDDEYEARLAWNTRAAVRALKGADIHDGK